MNPIPPPEHGNDPLGWREQFRRALAHPKLADLGGEPDDEALRAAYQLASALGHCRLYGVDLGATDGTLPPDIAVAAARRWDRLLGEWTLKATRLEEVWAGSGEEFVALDASADLLGARMESWAVFLAIDEAYQDAVEHAVPRRHLKSLLDSALNALDRFDAALQEAADYLAPVAGTQLLVNWRAVVSREYRATPPWWLSGELEELFERIQTDAHGWLPQPRQRNTIMKPPANGAIGTVKKLLAAAEGLRVGYDSSVSATDGVFEPVPADLRPELAAYLARQYPHGLFRHQRRAVQGLLKGAHTVVATRTSSGKSLIYSVPVLNRLLTDPSATALFLFPQKALANDQLQRLIEAADSVPTLARMRAAKPWLISRYDGATPDDDKSAIRNEAQVLLTNPDMLHYGLLAWHERHWQRFFTNLRYVVADECHEYRGIFGTNVSYLFRRLRALCARYGSSPTFIATSATVQSPSEHMERLTGLPFDCVGPSEDGSQQGERKFWMVRPEEHPYDAGRKLTLALAESGLTVLTFCMSRTAAERMMARSGKDNKDPEPPFVRVYRAGLTRSEREEIEQGLKNRTVRAVFSTSALELGIDIGAIDVVVCVGLPNTMMSLWQRAGRAGRAGKQGAVVLIPGQTPIDTYYADHPEDLFARDHEPLVLNLANRSVTHMHYACAMKEAGDESRLDTATLGPEIAAVKKQRDAGDLQEDIFYVSDPHQRVRVRGAGDEAYRLMLDKEEIGEIDPFHLLHEAPRNGIYYHGGRRYRVQDVQQKERIVRLKPEFSPHVTTSNIGTRIRVRRASAVRKHGQVIVARAVLDVNDYLRNVTEKHLNGTKVREYPGAGMPNNWLPTEGTMLRLERPFWDEVTARLGDGAAKAALDTTARLFGSLFPTVTGPCDASDYSATADCPKDAPPAVYLYDMVPYGVGLAVEACDRMSDLVDRSTELVRGCECGSDEGCFRCVRNPQAEIAASKLATQALLEMLRCELATPPVESEPATEESRAATGKSCPKCNYPTTHQAKFCSNCGHKLETT
ncbi:DEAD/DEAH box helicase [Gemmata sp. JC673]|uniref:DEAD/DEAH box helicase n=1 Tax=Gemmata algarum TaxID=2975278 RepID=A0ABU5F5C2_9BACT|nr:DEAD/DEAH box helicase [Gemmata algarum]MDY3562689.1 DEAD/DEAH box helicase [Gemmata algarum]